ncbi:MAG: hypothetical protein FJX62_12520 [Alphaproteobacteria bacterium]|nr:hypothetical protein [Alphaproteobacteria bacterium]
MLDAASLKRGVAAALVLFVAALSGDAPAQESVAGQGPPTFQYFLDVPPAGQGASSLPVTARDVVVAKVRVAERPAYLVGRDQSGKPPPLPKDLFFARLEVLEVLSGTVQVGVQQDVFFGTPGLGARQTRPHTPAQLARGYFVVSYRGEDGVRRLVPFPIGAEAYDAWQKEVFEYERQRSRPGARP